MKCSHELCENQIQKTEEQRCGAFGTNENEGCDKYFCDSHLAIDGVHLFNGGIYKAPQLCTQCCVGDTL